MAEILLIRRSAFPRVLELTDRAILFNWGHLLWARIVAVHFADITRIRVWPDAFTMVTSRGEFTIGAARFRDREHYRAVRQFVSTKTAIVLPEQEPSRWAGFPFHRDALPVECPPCPPPLIHWVAPADWERFRRHVVKSKPVSAHLRRELWFFGRCLGFFLFPWLLLWLFLPIPTAPVDRLLSLPVDRLLSLGVILFCALLLTAYHWLSVIDPPLHAKISFRDDGITLTAGSGQTATGSYRDCCGWAVIEREFNGRILHFLLLKGWTVVSAFALPDADVRDRVVQILRDKQVPHVPDLKPSREEE